MSATVQRDFYRNGQVRQEVPLRNGHKQGVIRTWHRNGVLASEEPFENDLPHGICRQWDESGRLLGRYKMVHGTGIQRHWHDNGQLQVEVSTVAGQFCGRNRIWLRDGTLIEERFCLNGREVTPDTYRKMAAKNGRLPKFRRTPVKPLPKGLAKEKHLHRVFVTGLLEKPNCSEASAWLHKSNGDKTARLLGRFNREADAVRFVEDLYRAGARAVIVPDIYCNKAGDQFADGLLVRLPKDATKRTAIRKVCAQLQTKRLGAAQPGEDFGESVMYVSIA
ncbi:MAG: hypothetical protein PCFJNLEI_02383 [Verrucomicrobiae bacterium]|nr:hypothetical protein [Verrucomicrobiae bacterium]